MYSYYHPYCLLAILFSVVVVVVLVVVASAVVTFISLCKVIGLGVVQGLFRTV